MKLFHNAHKSLKPQCILSSELEANQYIALLSLSASEKGKKYVACRGNNSLGSSASAYSTSVPTVVNGKDVDL